MNKIDMEHKEFLDEKAFRQFFDKEAEEEKKSWEELMSKKLGERVLKRKAIAHVTIVNDRFELDMQTCYYQYTIAFPHNYSDFKVGEKVVLHDQYCKTGLESEIVEICDDNTMKLQVHPCKYSGTESRYFGKELQLDKALVDLRQHVYDPFMYKIVSDPSLLKKSILNTLEAPKYTPLDESVTKKVEAVIEGENFTEKQKEAIYKCLEADNYYLVQGPPGSGKSQMLAFMIAMEAAFKGKKVLIVGPNHLAINNLLEKVLGIAPLLSGILFKIGQWYNAPKATVDYEGEPHMVYNIDFKATDALNTIISHWVVGTTPHALYSSRAEGLKCDTVVIDEAGQMSIPLAQMAMLSGKKVIMVGDHKQLPPIIRSEELPDDMKCSAFERLYSAENCTTLDKSFRMCRPICDFVSEIFYDGELQSAKAKSDNEFIESGNPLLSFDAPIVALNVVHSGKQDSIEEAKEVAEIVKQYINKGITADRIGILVPFRAQAACIRRTLRKSNDLELDSLNDLVVDTIDKMQGQEREIIIVSLTAGDAEYVADMSDFLYKPNKLNVAFSRAKSKLIIVGNSDEISKINKEENPHIAKILNSERIAWINA